ncbi:VWA domain-containing protein [Tamilnaduibacter salinus]|nr:VWA domain-containing protein [Tamilnaduibacter salinus]
MKWKAMSTATLLCVSAIGLSGCLADAPNVPVEGDPPKERTQGSGESTTSPTVSGQDVNIELYGDIDPDLTQEAGSDNPALLLDDSDVSYAGAGMTATESDSGSGVQSLAASADFQKQIADISGRVKTALENDGASVSELVNRVVQGPTGEVASLVYDVSYESAGTTKSSGELRNLLIGELGSDANVAELPSGTADQAEFRVALALVATPDQALTWVSAFPVANAGDVSSRYGALNNGTAIVPAGTSRNLTKGQNEFEQSASASNAVDILWVIDNSGSMGEEQENLGAGVDQFFTKLNSAGVDYRLAATTTDGSTCESLRSLPADDTKTFITPDTPNAAAQWSQDNPTTGIARPGTSGSPNETGFYCADRVDRSTFDREGAADITVFVSDEEENETSDEDQPSGQSGYTVRDYNTYEQRFVERGDTFFAIVGEHDQIKRTADDSYGDTNATECNGEGGEAEGGSHYREVARVTGGSASSICSKASSWSVMYDEIIETATGLASRFTLDRSVLPSSVEVDVNGQSVPRDPSRQNGFDVILLEDGARIAFYGDALPENGDAITVTYDYVPE